MGIAWSRASYGSPRIGMRVGISVSQTKVTHGSSTCKATVKYYVWDQYAYRDAGQNLRLTGSISGNHPFNNHWGSYTGSGWPKSAQAKLYEETYTYTYGSTSYGKDAKPGTHHFGAQITGAFNGASPSKTVAWTPPTRPVAKPATPGDTKWSYISDTRARIKWATHSTAAAPYDSQEVIRYRWVHSRNEYDAGTKVATLSGRATAWTDTGIRANQVYYWHVRARNSAGWSGESSNGSATAMNTTPADPSNIRAKVTGGGSTITLSGTDNSYDFHSVVLDIERSSNGGSYSTIKSVSSLPWTDPNPDAGTNRYAVSARVTTGNVLSSARVKSNTVSTIVPPLAPTGLSPDGTVFDLDSPVTLSWTHNDGGDGVDQSHREVRTSDDNGQNWVTQLTNDASGDESWTLPGGRLSNGPAYLWQSRTEGVVSEGFGPWSDSATLTGSKAPTVAITSPSSSTLTTGHISVAWDYAQDDNLPQVRWEAALAHDNLTIEQAHGSNDDATHEFDTYGINGDSYSVKVRVQSRAGVWSDWATVSFTLDLPIPAALDVDASYDIDTGTMLISLESKDPESGQIPSVRATVERSTDLGETWVRLTKAQQLPFDLVDPLPTIMGENIYRWVPLGDDGGVDVPGARDSVPVMAPSGAFGPTLPTRVPFQLAGPDGMVYLGVRQWLFVNFGATFDQILRSRSDVAVTSTSSRAAASTAYLGRRRPGASFGQNRSREVSVSLSSVYPTSNVSDLDYFKYDSPPIDWETLAQEATIVCLRDYTGRRVFGYVDEVARDDGRPGKTGISFKVIETDFVEAYG